MSIIIGESGASKTDWRIISSDGKVEQARGKGFNPNYQDSKVLLEEVEKTLAQKVEGNVSAVYFYGAGCSLPENSKKITEVFLSIFPGSNVEVNSDLLAAARSLCGQDQGIACILGTGANSCFYNGEVIEKNVASLGYILGDEGSGSWLGKELLGEFIRDEMPMEIKEKLTKRFGLNREDIIREVYQKGAAIQYLSNFSKFIFQNIKSPYLHRMVYRGFELFFEKNVMKYDNCQEHPVHFTGSVAYFYSNILRKVAADKGFVLKNVIESPIAGLTLFHQNKP